jgi:lysophospholipid acyltransferase (LPLAT)-like uncharacterized protein
MLKKFGRHPLVLKAVGNLLASYLLLVRNTSSLTIDPPDLFERLQGELPVIIAMWHGQHFMVPLGRLEDWDMRVMISRSADGEINAIAARKLGMGLIRASGAHRAHQMRKRGGMRGFLECLGVLREGASVGLTADVPKGPARVAGLGIVQLAKHSGCPIVPVAIATSRHIDLDSWDKASINLPFSRTGLAIGEPIRVDAEADEGALEVARLAVEAGLDAATAKAYELTEGGSGRKWPWPKRSGSKQNGPETAEPKTTGRSSHG